MIKCQCDCWIKHFDANRAVCRSCPSKPNCVLTLTPAARARIQVVWVEPVGSVHFGKQLPDVHHLGSQKKQIFTFSANLYLVSHSKGSTRTSVSKSIQISNKYCYWTLEMVSHFLQYPHSSTSIFFALLSDSKVDTCTTLVPTQSHLLQRQINKDVAVPNLSFSKHQTFCACDVGSNFPLGIEYSTEYCYFSRYIEVRNSNIVTTLMQTHCSSEHVGKNQIQHTNRQ